MTLNLDSAWVAHKEFEQQPKQLKAKYTGNFMRIKMDCGAFCVYEVKGRGIDARGETMYEKKEVVFK